MLSNHHGRSTIVCPSDPGHSETIKQSIKVSRPSSLLQLFLIDDIRVVEVSSGDDGVRSKLEEGLESFIVFTVFHQPSWRFGAKVDSDQKDESWDKGRTELKSPRDITRVLDDHVGAETKEDSWLSARFTLEIALTSYNPELPEHNESTSDSSRSHLGRVDGDSCIFGSDSNTHDESYSEQGLPRMGETGCNGCSGKTSSSEEDFSSSTEVVIERVDDPCSAASSASTTCKIHFTHIKPAVRKMIELTNPTIHLSRPGPAIPNSLGNDKLAPLEPV